MFLSLCILGRQPALGLAELESLFGGDALQPIGSGAVLLTIEPATIPFAYLGGTIKFCKVLTQLPTTQWGEIQHFLETAVIEHARQLPEGKLKLGLSTYELKVSPKQLIASGLTLKKLLRADGRSVRIVPNNETALNSAQVLHNGLTAQLGWELIFVKHGTDTVIAQTIAVQDIDAYARRDQGRPKRDARVGMLPPKLAQMMVNLAAGGAPAPVCHPKTGLDKTLLDPFCGSGVVLQEAALMGYSVYGTDLDPRMVEYAKVNLDWLGEQIAHPPFSYHVETGDATNFLWPRPSDLLASEAYLGPPMSHLPAPDALKEIVQDTNLIIKKFLKNLAYQTERDYRLCLAVPAWQTPKGFVHLPLIDQMSDLGYNRLSFVHAASEDLIYHREGQIVARELLILTRK